ncbi:hypothetical protein CRG98_039300 [Punica granatum]|uniref:Transmembrane protein n=1 Tax=Punica granatum TaxID=22663 RepID=A0A2I0I8F1_PUNGR|nr:hypothetical protein CRG98_039300 [Punica granatum]
MSWGQRWSRRFAVYSPGSTAVSVATAGYPPPLADSQVLLPPSFLQLRHKSLCCTDLDSVASLLSLSFRSSRRRGCVALFMLAAVLFPLVSVVVVEFRASELSALEVPHRSGI